MCAVTASTSYMIIRVLPMHMYITRFCATLGFISIRRTDNCYTLGEAYRGRRRRHSSERLRVSWGADAQTTVRRAYKDYSRGLGCRSFISILLLGSVQRFPKARVMVTWWLLLQAAMRVFLPRFAGVTQ
jgi:hypothetical protein